MRAHGVASGSALRNGASPPPGSGRAGAPSPAASSRPSKKRKLEIPSRKGYDGDDDIKPKVEPKLEPKVEAKVEAKLEAEQDEYVVKEEPGKKVKYEDVSGSSTYCNVIPPLTASAVTPPSMTTAVKTEETALALAPAPASASTPDLAPGEYDDDDVLVVCENRVAADPGAPPSSVFSPSSDDTMCTSAATAAAFDYHANYGFPPQMMMTTTPNMSSEAGLVAAGLAGHQHHWLHAAAAQDPASFFWGDTVHEGLWSRDGEGS